MFIRASQITKCNVANTHGRHAFSFFNWDSRTVALRVLLDAGADKEARDYLGQSPLHLASVHDDLDCLGILLDSNAAIDVRSLDNQSPVTVAFDHDNGEMLRILLWQASANNRTGLSKIEFDFTSQIFTTLLKLSFTFLNDGLDKPKICPKDF